MNVKSPYHEAMILCSRHGVQLEFCLVSFQESAQGPGHLPGAFAFSASAMPTRSQLPKTVRSRDGRLASSYHENAISVMSTWVSSQSAELLGSPHTQAPTLRPDGENRFGLWYKPGVSWPFARMIHTCS